MKQRYLLILLSLVHVHLSILTGPVYLLLMIQPPLTDLPEPDAKVLYGMLVQCSVTAFLGYKFFSLRKIWIWLISVVICLILGMLLRNAFSTFFGSLLGWDDFFENIYSTSYFAGHAILLFFIQLLFLTLYWSLSSIKKV